jgi:predicted PurR-regulated permease PerM
MFSVDDRAGNVVTTVALFLIVVAVLYLARGAFFVLFLSVLFSYLLEPAVKLAQQHTSLGRKNRTWAIALVYLLGTIVLGGFGYEFGPRVVAQLKNFYSAVPQILQGLSGGDASGLRVPRHLTAAQQLQVRDWIAHHHDVIDRIAERGAASAAYIAERAVWLLVIPILAIFILRDGRQIADGFFRTVTRGHNQTIAKQVLYEVDAMLAKYIRAQLVLAALSFVFYSISMMLLGFPYAIAMGVVGGALEFLPAVGWIASAAMILTIGFLTHAHWIWMAGLLGLWRLVQDYVNSPHIMGRTLELSPLTVLVALMVGGQVGGIVGLYLSVPTVAVLRIIWLKCLPAQGQEAAQKSLAQAGQ